MNRSGLGIKIIFLTITAVKCMNSIFFFGVGGQKADLFKMAFDTFSTWLFMM